MQPISASLASAGAITGGVKSAPSQLLNNRKADQAQDNTELRKQFDNFVGETFYGQMLSAMRKTVDKPAYFDGGRAEEAFRGQLDQILSTKMAEASAGSFSGPMFELFKLNRS